MPRPPLAAPAEDLTGRVFDRLRVVSLAGRAPNSPGHWLWNCVCSCGATPPPVRGDSLLLVARGKPGGTGSCGCRKAETSTTNLAGAYLAQHGKRVVARRWTTGEDAAAMSADPAAAVAERIGRTAAAVEGRRTALRKRTGAPP